MNAPTLTVTLRWGHDVDVVSAPMADVSVASSGDATVVVVGSMMHDARRLHADEVVKRCDIAGEPWTDGLDRLVARSAGDFAIVSHRSADDQLTLVANAASTVPLFYTRRADGVEVSTDFPAADSTALHLGSLVDHDALAATLAAHPMPADRTLRLDVMRVAPGHRVTLGPTEQTAITHWRPADRPTRTGAVPEAAAELRNILRTVVSEISARQPDGLGLHLTPGLDSTTVARLVLDECRRNGRPDPIAYTWQPPPAAGCPTLDQRLVADVAAAFEVEVRWQVPNDGFVDLLQIDPLAVPTNSTLANELSTMRAAQADGVETIVCGWGGDEFASYNSRHRARAVHRRLRRAAHRFVDRQGRKRLGIAHPGFASARLPRPAQRTDVRIGPTARSTQAGFLQSNHLTERIDAWSVAGSAHGVGYAYPLLDRRVLDFVFSLDESMFDGHRQLMREVARGLVPESVRLNRDKTDRARSEASRDDAEAAFAAVRTVGLDAFTDPGRRSLLDLQRLERALDRTPVRHRGKVVRALQFGARRDLDLAALRSAETSR